MHKKYKLLDLYCGAGGAAVGYNRAGFEVTGVDNKQQKNYPFEFYQNDALEFLKRNGKKYDVIHASPPCQAYSISKNNGCHKNAPKLLTITREALKEIGKHYVIENVLGAPFEHAIMICGASFGLGVGGFDLCRHRYFESNLLLLTLPCIHKRGKTIGVYGNGTNSYHRNKFGRCVTLNEMKEAMGIEWMTRKELTQAIPPAYTEFIGNQIYEYLENILGLNNNDKNKRR